jgi:hypothetical protein
MQRGNPETAAEYQQLAQDTIAYVADHIIERQLQEKFLNQPEIAQIKSAEIK